MGHVVRLGALLHELPTGIELVGCVDETLARPHFPRGVEYRPPTLNALAAEISAPVRKARGPTVVIFDLPAYDQEFSVFDGGDLISLAVDEFGDPGVSSDIVVNPSDYWRTCVYRRLPPHGLVLRGPSYAMLRRPFALPQTRLARDQRFGFVIGSGQRAAQWAHDIINNFDTSDTGEIPMVVSPTFPDFVDARARASKKGIRLQTGIEATEMCALYDSLRLCIMTGGSAILEAMSRATPVLSYPILEFMAKETQDLAELGVVIELPENLSRAYNLRPLISKLLEDDGGLRRIGTAARHFVDGRGAARVAAIIMDVADTVQNGISKADTLARYEEAS